MATEISSVFPISGIAGSGTYEGAMVIAPARSGVSVSMSFAVAVNLHLYVLGTSGLFGPRALLLAKSAG